MDALDQSLPLLHAYAGKHQAGQAWKYQAGVETSSRTGRGNTPMQAWKHKAMEGMETLGRPGVAGSEPPRKSGMETPGRHGDTRQAWKHQATRGVETSGRRGNIKQAWRHQAGQARNY